MTIRHVFLDMDGVIVDFVRPAIQLHGQPEAIHRWPVGEWDVPTVLGISAAEFWAKIDVQGHAFWSQLPVYPWTASLIDTVRQFASFAILSCPSHHPECLSGKVSWLQRHLGPEFRDFLIGPPKYHCAKSDVVLIDDSDANVERFRASGGRAILFPQIWNRNHAIEDRLGYVAQQLSRLSGSDGPESNRETSE